MELDIQIGPEQPQLRDAPQRTGADDRAEFQIAQLAADNGVVRFGALRYRGDGEARRQFGREVFQAVHGEIDAAFEQRFFDFFGEKPLAADFTEGRIVNPVARGPDDLDPAFRAARFQTLLDIIGLPERQLRASSPDHQHKSQCNQRVAAIGTRRGSRTFSLLSENAAIAACPRAGASILQVEDLAHGVH